jgi:hypothetical protein
MNEISHFYGITIEMIPDKGYMPNVIANFNDYRAMFSANSGVLMDGEFPDDKSRLVQAWVLLHKEEINKSWNDYLANFGYVLKKIAPLR